MIDIFVVISIIISIVALVIAINYYLHWCNKRCPYCGHRMTYIYKRVNDKSIEHGFRCNKCQAWLYIKAGELLKRSRKNGTK